MILSLLKDTRTSSGTPEAKAAWAKVPMRTCSMVDSVSRLKTMVLSRPTLLPPQLTMVLGLGAVGALEEKPSSRPAAAEGEQQRRTTESVIRIVGNAFPHHSQADQHRREEGEQGG